MDKIIEGQHFLAAFAARKRGKWAVSPKAGHGVPLLGLLKKFQPDRVSKLRPKKEGLKTKRPVRQPVKGCSKLGRFGPQHPCTLFRFTESKKYGVNRRVFKLI
ncbi:hypothetical protein [Chimaeribacter coloradensis]|uniref:hypothetical protein n=1 Tax=Chimaeribacter coloradensis TaxID=2060068 RepID=UPI0013FD0CCD|nr:hypothetical protein [Chimaeribacter coloradensis]